MKEIYNQIWNLAKPYYKKGRPMDIDHIEWMMEDAMFVCEKENIDDTLLLPLVILHDVGYAVVPKDNPFNLDLRKAHMEAGAKIAKEILEKLDYDPEKTKKIAYFVSVHDNWALNDNDVFKDKILGIFNDLDFIWTATKKGFPAIMKILNLNQQEMYDWIVKENTDKENKRPYVKSTKELYNKYMEERKNEL